MSPSSPGQGIRPTSKARFCMPGALTGQPTLSPRVRRFEALIGFELEPPYGAPTVGVKEARKFLARSPRQKGDRARPGRGFPRLRVHRARPRRTEWRVEDPLPGASEDHGFRAAATRVEKHVWTNGRRIGRVVELCPSWRISWPGGTGFARLRAYESNDGTWSQNVQARMGQAPALQSRRHCRLPASGKFGDCSRGGKIGRCGEAELQP